MDAAPRHQTRRWAFLDFGCGAGRSARFLRALSARHVYAVDHDQDMIGQALSRGLDAVTFIRTGDTIPRPDASVGGAVSMNVFIEIRTPSEMRRACAEIARILTRARRGADHWFWLPGIRHGEAPLNRK
ncbi:MAG TPA: class I SAM-dependent methyltransferase [Streptosporangiaceae bacterium]|nr:class I SAM-dependent methyltransferase [Streptosporangiaceae bacterium]